MNIENIDWSSLHEITIAAKDFSRSRKINPKEVETDCREIQQSIQPFLYSSIKARKTIPKTKTK